MRYSEVYTRSRGSMLWFVNVFGEERRTDDIRQNVLWKEEASSTS